ncbi:PAS domain-containing protein [Marivita geojedonensis]|nr:PAS domain-containing protein [Marivita geojedonensis]
MVFWPPIIVGLVCAGAVAAWIFQRNRPVPYSPDTTFEQSLSLLFQDGVLVDADDEVWPLLADIPTPITWESTRKALIHIVPSLPLTLTEFEPNKAQSPVSVSLRKVAGGYRVTFLPTQKKTSKQWFLDRQNEVAVSQIRPALLYAPDPIWCVDARTEVIWGNEAFCDLSGQHGGKTAFATQIAEQIFDGEILCSKRIKLEGSGSVGPKWLEVTRKETETGILFYANGADAVVHAEEAQRNFVQTLSKTFANLTTGLAIFDRERRLALFNPALIDLSGISVEFLSNRPPLFEFFDKLRERRVMPEPKNYDNWREKMAKLVAAASDDRYRETWNLAGGQTFDVTGRPYPDGAIAFLFNDITAEVSLTRGFRAELETMQSMIDAMEDAVAAFTQQGVLTVCNTAYKLMWKVDPDTRITEFTIMEATQEWKTAFHPSPVWPELRDFVTTSTERASWDSDLRAKDGRRIVCRVDPICYGATLVRFCHQPKVQEGANEQDGLQIVSA